MFFVYKPEGVEPTRWKFEPFKLMSPEVEAIEEAIVEEVIAEADAEVPEA